MDEYFGESGDDVDLLARRGARADRLRRRQRPGRQRLHRHHRGVRARHRQRRRRLQHRDRLRRRARERLPRRARHAENGVDEDCDGHDDVNLDRDGDTFPVPLDCNDADPKIRPGTFEIRGNAVDENCDRRALPLAQLASLVSTKWRLTARRRVCASSSCATRRPALASRSPATGPDARSATVRSRPSSGTSRPCGCSPSSARAAAPGRPHRGEDHRGPARSAGRYSYRIVRNVLPAAPINVPRPRRQEGEAMLKRRLLGGVCAAVALALLAPAAAQATAIISIEGSTILYAGAAGDIDQIAVYETPTSYRITRFGAGQIGGGPDCDFIDGDLNTVDCNKSGHHRDRPATSTTATTSRRSAATHHGPRDLQRRPRERRAVRRRRARHLQWRPRRRQHRRPRRRAPSRSTAATATTPPSPTTRTPGSRARRSRATPTATACAARRTATTPTPASGRASPTCPTTAIDEDCSGVDAINTDRDGDGVPRPQDCDDTNAAIRPGIREVRGNDVDENCDTRIPPFPPLVRLGQRAPGGASGTRRATSR